jgi:hypothetical protein
VCVPSATAGIFPDSPFSDGAAGTTGAAFLKLPASARALALGSSLVGAADNSEAIFWNPAGLAQMEKEGRSEVSFGYSALLETSYAGTLAYARPFVGERGVLGAALVYFSQSSIQGFDTVGNPNGEFTPTDFALSLSYAKKLSNYGVGTTIKFIRSEIADASGSSFAIDLGIQGLRVADFGDGKVDIGASLLNLGPAIQTGSVADPLPFKFQAGALWHISPRFRGLLDGHIPVDDNPYVSLGLEVLTPKRGNMSAAFRAGFNIRNQRDVDGLTGMSAGFGAHVAQLRFDYAWVPLGDLGQTHRISIGYGF